MKMGYKELAPEYQIIRDRLLRSTELSELATLSLTRNGDLTVAPLKTGVESIVVRFKGYVELHSIFGYMYDFFWIEGNPEIDAYAEHVVQVTIKLLKGLLVYTYELDSHGNKLGGGVVEIEDLEGWIERGYRTLYFC